MKNAKNQPSKPEHGQRKRKLGNRELLKNMCLEE